MSKSLAQEIAFTKVRQQKSHIKAYADEDRHEKIRDLRPTWNDPANARIFSDSRIKIIVVF
jgi:hypothetical protein